VVEEKKGKLAKVRKESQRRGDEDKNRRAGQKVKGMQRESKGNRENPRQNRRRAGECFSEVQPGKTGGEKLHLAESKKARKHFTLRVGKKPGGLGLENEHQRKGDGM